MNDRIEIVTVLADDGRTLAMTFQVDDFPNRDVARGYTDAIADGLRGADYDVTVTELTEARQVRR